MNTRREFIVQSGRALGAWLVGAEAARRILWLAAEKEEPYLVEVESLGVELWATNLGYEYVFSLGCSYYSITGPHLTWRDWLERKDVDVSKEKEIKDYLEDWGWYCPEDGELWVPPDLDADLPETRDSEDPGMAVDLADLNESLPPPAGLLIRPGQDDLSWQNFSITMALGFGSSSPDARVTNGWYEILRHADPETIQAYVGWLKGKPVATSISSWRRA